MVKVEEVRYDNLLRSYLTKDILKVNWLTMKHLEDGNFQNAYTPDIPVYEPIQLTKDLVERLGFDRVMHTIRLENGDVFYLEDCTFNGWSFSILQSHSDETCGPAYLLLKHVKYVHELQNIYFALTGSELNIENV